MNEQKAGRIRRAQWNRYPPAAIPFDQLKTPRARNFWAGVLRRESAEAKKEALKQAARNRYTPALQPLDTPALLEVVTGARFWTYRLVALELWVTRSTPDERATCREVIAGQISREVSDYVDAILCDVINQLDGVISEIQF